jgi:hypothetical protein
VLNLPNRVADDAERGQRNPAHRIYIAQRIGRGNLAEHERVLSHRREDVNGENQRPLRIEPIDPGVVRGLAADQQVRVTEYRKLLQNLPQVFLTDLARSARSPGVVKQTT